MKRFSGFIIIFFLAVVSTCWSQVNEDLVLTDKDTFGNFRCGMSKKEVENVLNVKLKYNKKAVHYYAPYFSYYNIPSMVGFRFEQNKLISSDFSIWTYNKNAYDLVKDHFRIMKIFKDEYGEYYYNGTSWKVKMDNPTLDDYANALENENVDLHFIWHTKKIVIYYYLYKDSSDPLWPYNMDITVICSGDN